MYKSMDLKFLFGALMSAQQLLNELLIFFEEAVYLFGGDGNTLDHG